MATIYKRGNIWWGRAQRKGKEYRVSLETGNRRTAQDRLDKWVKELAASRWGGRNRVSFATAAKSFVVNYLPTLEPASAKRYGVSLKWLSDKFGESMMDEIGREELSSFEGWRRALGASSPTIRRDLACLSSLFTYCEDHEWTDDNSNPVPGFLRRRAKRGLKESPGRRRYLSEAEEQAVLEGASPNVHDAICLAIDTGLRREELLTLTWPQVDFRMGVIRTTNKTKNGRERTVPMPERSATILTRIKAVGKPSFYVLCHDDGCRFVSFQKGWKAAIRRARLADAEWHDLRRTAGCRWLQRDRRSMEEVCLLLGHSSVAVTEKCYAFLEEETVAAEVAAAQKPARPARKAK